jgi:quercetin dioxygenase-like cupin family protein
MSIHESNRAFKIELSESKPFQMQGALWRVLATGKETDGIVGALDERITHGMAAPMHSHEDADEIFYVLDGKLTFFVGEKRIEATEGAFVYLPRYIHHGFQVDSEEARVFNFVTPAGFEQLIVDQGKAAKFDDLPIANVPGAQPQLSKDILKKMRQKYSVRYFLSDKK